MSIMERLNKSIITEFVPPSNEVAAAAASAVIEILGSVIATSFYHLSPLALLTLWIDKIHSILCFAY